MRTSISAHHSGVRERRQNGGRRAPDLPGDLDGQHEAALAALAQEQMLVNQALVEKIVACERAEEALRISEQKLHDLLAHQHAVREDERKHISRQLHDTLAQNLLALRLDIVMMHQQTTSRHYRLRDRINAALDNVDITLRSVKEMLGELRPACLELGLHATVDMELRKFRRASGIAADLHAGPDIDELQLREEDVLTVHRVLQECLNNVCRHSLASRVRVRLEHDAHVLCMAMVDNGIGFDPAAPRQPSGYGLLDLHERVARHGGVLVVRSAKTHGTEVVLKVPTAPMACSSQIARTVG